MGFPIPFCQHFWDRQWPLSTCAHHLVPLGVKSLAASLLKSPPLPIPGWAGEPQHRQILSGTEWLGAVS